MTTGCELLAKALVDNGIDTMYFLMGGPNHETENALHKLGVRMIDVRHEQAAAMMAHAHSRVLQRPAVCMGSAGPGTLNLHSGLANALIDGAPMVALGGSSPLDKYCKNAFQEIDQLAIMKPVTKWAQRVYEARRIPDLVDTAFRQAMSGKPGPVYLDLPADVIHEEVAEEDLKKIVRRGAAVLPRPGGDPRLVGEALQVLARAERPVVIFGNGALWSQAGEQLKAWVEATGIPFYAGPQARGCIPEDHEYSYMAARTSAFKNADVVMVVGSRLNYALSWGNRSRFAASSVFIHIDIDHAEIDSDQRSAVRIVGDARTVLEQMTAALPGADIRPQRYAAWRDQLKKEDAEKSRKLDLELNSKETPIHPMRLCREIRDFMDRDAILVVDGREILNYGRFAIPTFFPGHRLNSGVFGTMGVGMPFGVAAKLAKPDKQVIVLHGDGSFGMNAMEFDTAVRHKIPVTVVISLNGGWTADPERNKLGRDLGYTRFDRIAVDLGGFGEFVEDPDQIRPALERAKAANAAGQPALVNVVTDWRARASTRRSSWET